MKIIINKVCYIFMLMQGCTISESDTVEDKIK